ncbi:MAG: PPC domain-containing protein, partial [Planctomycetales bacterium]|nr:PPC domain-containing protein [Planctomycetales bacterium]
MGGAILTAIINSTLITNGTSHVAEATHAPSLLRPLNITNALGGIFSERAIYVENATDYAWMPVAAVRRMPGMSFTRVVPIGNSVQPFYRVVNNTIFGDDGYFSFFPEQPTSANPLEPNDTIANAIDTRQGPQHNPRSYTATNVSIGDNPNFTIDPTRDVDFYQFQLDIGDRVTIDVTTPNPNSNLDAYLRLFDATGREVDVDDDRSALDTDPFIDFTLTPGGTLQAGTYYVAVSSAGNEDYDPLSLGGRLGNATSGAYNITVDVSAPRKWVVDTINLTNPTFTITAVNGQQRTFTVGSTGRAPNQNTPAMSGQIVGNVNDPNQPPIPGVSAYSLGSQGTRYVVIEGAAVVETTGGVSLLPLANNSNNENEFLRETGILISEEATPTLMNNVLANLRNGVVEVENQTISGINSPRTSVQTGQLFQYNTNSQNGIIPGPGLAGVSTRNMAVSRPGGRVNSETLLVSLDGVTGILSENSDFNIPLVPNEPLFVNALDGNLFPAPLAKSIDSSVDNLPERDELITVKDPMGIGLSPILSPDLDVFGQLRVDDPDVDTPQGQGGNVFKDRGSLDRSDFVGPAAVLLRPGDNDADGIDLDSSISVVQVSEGVYSRFLIQLVDGFESADPFPGVGVDDTTINGRPVDIEENGISYQVRGPAITLFKDGVFQQEGLDYTFSYDATSNTIVLTPLAGIWPDDKTYTIRLNNRDRFVIDAPVADTLQDGDTFTITADDGSTAV